MSTFNGECVTQHIVRQTSADFLAAVNICVLPHHILVFRTLVYPRGRPGKVCASLLWLALFLTCSSFSRHLIVQKVSCHVTLRVHEVQELGGSALPVSLEDVPW